MSTSLLRTFTLSLCAISVITTPLYAQTSLQTAPSPTTATSEASPPIVAPPPASTVSEQANTATPIPEVATSTSMAQTTATELVAKPFAYSGRVPFGSLMGTGQGQRYPDEVLRIVDRSHSGLAVGLMILGALAGSFFNTVGKEDNRGRKIDDLKHPADEKFIQILQKKIDAWLDENKSTEKFKNPLSLRQDTFSLIYNDMNSDKATYDLNIGVSYVRKADSAGWFTAPNAVGCFKKFSGNGFGIEEWQANDYSEVKKQMLNFIQECAGQFTNEIPKLLKN